MDHVSKQTNFLKLTNTTEKKKYPRLSLSSGNNGISK